MRVEEIERKGEGEGRARNVLYPLTPFWTIFDPIPVVVSANLDLQQKYRKVGAKIY